MSVLKKKLLLGGQLGQIRRGGNAPSVGRDARGELNDIDKARPHDGAIVDGVLALHGAVCIVADFVGLLVVDDGDGGSLALDLQLQLEELLGVQAHGARVGGDLGGVLVWNARSTRVVTSAASGMHPKEEEEVDAKEGPMVVVIVAVLVGRTGSALVFMEDLQFFPL
jgi:hypothetical protein